MVELPQIEEVEINVDLPIGDNLRFQAFQRFLERFNDKVQNEGVSIKLDFKIAYTGELCAYYEDSYEYAFYFDDWYLRSLIQKHGTMIGTIQSFNGDDILHMTFGLKVFPKELAKSILSENVIEDEDELEGVDSFTGHDFAKTQMYEPHIEVYNTADYKGKTIKNSNVCLSIVGMQYHNHDGDVFVGSELVIKPEYGNPFDEHALGYYNEYDELIGYVPRREQAVVRLFLAKGKLNAKVYNISDKFVDTVVSLTKDMVDLSKTEGLVCMLITKEKCQGIYSEGRRVCSISDLIDALD